VIVASRYSVAAIPSASVKTSYHRVGEIMRASRDVLGGDLDTSKQPVSIPQPVLKLHIIPLRRMSLDFA
jgi:hypothetical protein